VTTATGSRELITYTRQHKRAITAHAASNFRPIGRRNQPLVQQEHEEDDKTGSEEEEQIYNGESDADEDEMFDIATEDEDVFRI